MLSLCTFHVNYKKLLPGNHKLQSALCFDWTSRESPRRVQGETHFPPQVLTGTRGPPGMAAGQWGEGKGWEVLGRGRADPSSPACGVAGRCLETSDCDLLISLAHASLWRQLAGLSDCAGRFLPSRPGQFCDPQRCPFRLVARAIP